MEAMADLHPIFHVGALASVIALAMRSQLLLRVLLLLSLVLYIADNYFGSPEPAWPYMIWNVVFLLINLYVLFELLLDRTTFGLTDKEREVFGGFLSLSPGEFRRLIRIGEWRVADGHATLTVEGIAPTSLFYVYEGAIEIMKASRSTYVEPPAFIGEVAFVRGGGASASAMLAPGSRYIEWPAAQLRQYLARHSPMRIAFNRALSDDLAVKVARA